ncbi:MAG: hypothetical protein R3F29_08160 [Planctomycetota bacterium]
MTDLASLWLPILLSAVFVFIASSVIHMALPLHKNDYRRLPDDDLVRDALRKAGVGPGQYMFPGCESMKDMGTPEMQAKYAQGPVGVLVVRPNGMPAMGKALGQWFAFCLVVGVFTAYLTGLAVAPGAAYGHVFRVAGTVALLGFAFSSVTDSIWKGVSWTTTGKFVFDGVVYALVTGGTFGWLWPTAA